MEKFRETDRAHDKGTWFIFSGPYRDAENEEAGRSMLAPLAEKYGCRIEELGDFLAPWCGPDAGVQFGPRLTFEQRMRMRGKRLAEEYYQGFLNALDAVFCLPPGWEIQQVDAYFPDPARLAAGGD